MSDSNSDFKENTGAISWMAGHSVAANLVMAIFLIGGLICLANMKQEVFPDFEMGMVNVTVPYPGASPEEVETGILLVIEEAVRGLEGIEELRSVANEGRGVVTIELEEGADAQKLGQDIKAEVDRITTFPEEAEEPRVRVVARKRPVLTLVIYGQADRKSLHFLAEQVRDTLLQNPRITQVEVEGLPPLEISIELSFDTLRRYNLSIGQVAAKLKQASIDLPGGGLKTKKGEILIRVKEKREYGREFAQIPIITTENGSEVRLGEIAKIDDSFADTDRYTNYNGMPAVVLEVFRIGTQTPIQVASAVKEELVQAEALLPGGINTAILSDRSKHFRQRMNLLLKNGALGLMLVMIVLGLFLEIRLAFWVMMGIPISFLGAFLILPSADLSINMISMFAFIISLGIVVDDAIVVGEIVYYHHQEGLPFRQAAVIGAQEVAMPVTFSILTNMVTFLPLYFIPGFIGKIFKMIPIVVCTVFFISLLESLFILPAHLAPQKADQGIWFLGPMHNWQQAFSNMFRRWVKNIYGPILNLALKYRYLTLAFAFSVLIISLTYAASGRMGIQLFPVIPSDFSQAELVLPFGSPIEKTEAVMSRLLLAAQKIIKESGHPQLVVGITSDVGRGGSHAGRVRVELAVPEIRDKIMSTEKFTRLWRELVGEVIGVEYLKFADDAGGPGGRGRAITVELSHRNMSVLEKASQELADIISSYPGTSDVDDGFQPGKRQFNVTILPEGKRMGLTARDVAHQVRSAFFGSEVLRQQRGRNEIKVMVRLPEEIRKKEHTIQEIMIRTPSGIYVPLQDIARLKEGHAFKSIDRRNGRRVVQVSSDFLPRNKADDVLTSLKVEAMPELLKKYPGLSYSFEGHRADIRKSLASLKISFVLAMLVVFTMLAIPFRSYTQPLIVMVAIPFGIVGAFLGHLIMGYSLCLPSLFGVVALSGVVVNDSLVMVDFANRRHKQGGLIPFEAILSAAIQRFRPIMLTTLTTFCGLAPLIFETSRQARFLIPMGISLGYGILFATFITLFIVPALYLALDDIIHLKERSGQFIFGN
ncbi:efflux RND transporter permease subunit [Candidatus Riflebacteria bacterium]